MMKGSVRSCMVSWGKHRLLWLLKSHLDLVSLLRYIRNTATLLPGNKIGHNCQILWSLEEMRLDTILCVCVWVRQLLTHLVICSRNPLSQTRPQSAIIPE